jgi:hypothetical protein
MPDPTYSVANMIRRLLLNQKIEAAGRARCTGRYMVADSAPLPKFMKVVVSLGLIDDEIFAVVDALRNKMGESGASSFDHVTS